MTCLTPGYAARMNIGGDPAAIRLLATRARDWEADLRGVQGTLAGAGGIEWVSSAASAYRAQLEQRADEAGAAADRLADLAADLDRLADTLESRQQALVSAFTSARQAWDDAVEAGEEAAGGAWEFAGDMLGFARNRLGW